MVERLAEQELRQKAVQALEEKLGPVETLRFLALLSREPFDYPAWRDRYFSRYTADALFQEMRKEQKQGHS
jgi:hypothetical protein